MWKTEYMFTVSTGIRKVSSSQVLIVSVNTSMKAEVLPVYWSVAFRWVLTQCQEWKIPAMIFKEAIVAVFQSNSQVGHSRPIFPGIDVKANSMLIKKALHLRPYRPQLLNVRVHDSTIRNRLKKYGRMSGETLFSLKIRWQHDSYLKSCIWTNRKTKQCPLDNKEQIGAVCPRCTAQI